MPWPGPGVGQRNAGSDAQRDPVLEQAEERRQQGDRAEHRRHDADRRGQPSALTSGMPATPSDSSAITTVPPAKTIALPEVATALAMESCIDMPARSCS